LQFACNDEFVQDLNELVKKNNGGQIIQIRTAYAFWKLKILMRELVQFASCRVALLSQIKLAYLS
jgi:hypothetical protein